MVVVERTRFFALGAATLGPLKSDQQQGIEFLLTALEGDADMRDLRWCAYLLATVDHECRPTWRPIHERGGADYFATRYGPETRVGKMLGNATEDDAIRFHGRGFVQLTGRVNYRRFSGLVGVDLMNEPDLALEPTIAYRIASIGMRTGAFTGKRLGDFLNGTGLDWVAARRVINGLDCATDIAKRGMQFHAALQGAAAA